MAATNMHPILYVTKSRRIGDWDRYDNRFWRATIFETGALEIRYGKNHRDYSLRVYAPGQWITYEAR